MSLGLKKKCLNIYRNIYTKLIYSYRKNINIGRNVVIEGKIELNNNGIVEIGENSIIRRWVCLKPWGGKIKIGKNCSINSFCHISGNGEVEIGDDVLIATQCVIISANHNFENLDILIREQSETRAKIKIEDNCWLGAGVKVLAGVTIHSGSVIGAGSIVTKDIPPNSIAYGVPAKVVRKRDIDNV